MTRTPSEVAAKLHGYLMDELELENERFTRLAAFRDAGWDDHILGMVKIIESPIDGATVKFFATYSPSRNEPISVKFDQSGTEWFATAEDALKFVDEVVATLENQDAQN